VGAEGVRRCAEQSIVELKRHLCHRASVSTPRRVSGSKACADAFADAPPGRGRAADLHDPPPNSSPGVTGGST
jgi:hypothetical protein